MAFRVTFWETIPGLPGMLQSSLTRGSEEFSTRADAEESATVAVSKGTARADILAVYKRSTRKLGHFTQAAPNVPSGIWWPA